MKTEYSERTNSTVAPKSPKCVEPFSIGSPRHNAKVRIANVEISTAPHLHEIAMKWTPPKKYADFAKNPLIESWLNDYSSYNTRTEHCKRLGRLVQAVCLTPEEIIEQVKAGNGRAVKESVKTFCRGLAAEGKTAMAGLILQSFRSFLESNEVQNLVVWGRKDMIPQVAVRTQRRVPKKEEIYRLIDGIEASNLGVERIARYKAMIWTAYQSGIRPSALLRLRIKNIDLNQQPPIPIKITPDIDSKIKRSLGHKPGYYWTFISHEARNSIREYLSLRERLHDENITPETYVFENFHYRGEKVGLVAWNKIVARLAKYGGFKKGEISPHTFRHAARKQYRPYVDDQIGTVLLGHVIKGAEESYFDRTDRDTLRTEYAKIDWNRETQLSQIEIDEQLKDRVSRAELIVLFDELRKFVSPEEARRIEDKVTAARGKPVITQLPYPAIESTLVVRDNIRN